MDLDFRMQRTHKVVAFLERKEKMVCPPKQDKHSLFEKPVFHLYTSKCKMRSIGAKLVSIIRQDNVYEYKKGHPRFATLYWSNGEPYY